MLRVLHITNLYPVPERPSYGIFIKRQVDSLTARGISNEVLLIRGFESKINYLRGIQEVREVLNKNRFDLVNVHYGLTTFTSNWIKGYPLVYTYYGSDVMDSLQGRISRAFASHANVHIVKSAQMKERLGIKSAIVLPDGIDLNLFKPIDKQEARRLLQVSPDARIILFIGNPASKVKRFWLAKDVVQKVSREFPDVQLMPLSGMPQEQLPAYYGAADLLLATSAWEGSPNCIKEALACGLPIVSTDVGDVRKRIQGVSSSYVETDSPDALAAHVMQILRNPQRTNGGEHIESLSWDHIAERIESVYEDVLTPPRDGHRSQCV
jgi:glycosyltransferase involved in cell wall biosynthesis